MKAIKLTLKGTLTATLKRIYGTLKEPLKKNPTPNTQKDAAKCERVGNNSNDSHNSNNNHSNNGENFSNSHDSNNSTHSSREMAGPARCAFPDPGAAAAPKGHPPGLRFRV